MTNEMENFDEDDEECPDLVSVTPEKIPVTIITGFLGENRAIFLQGIYNSSQTFMSGIGLLLCSLLAIAL